MRRKTRAFLNEGIDALALAIEFFNRPTERGRRSGVVMHLHHAFEMLLKAAVLEKTGRIRGRRESRNYDFRKCINVCTSQLGILDGDAHVALENIKGFRDAAEHDLIDISERMLYAHAQSALVIFGATYAAVFGRRLADELPSRVLPLSTQPPVEMIAMIQDEVDSVRLLLTPGTRRRAEAEAKLSVFDVIEESLRRVHGGDRRASTRQQLWAVAAGRWHQAFPLMSALVGTTPGGLPVVIRTDRKEGLPVIISDSSDARIAFRFAKPEDRYPYLTFELADSLGISPNKLYGLLRMFGLKGRDDYHLMIKIGSKSQTNRYSEKARRLLKHVIDSAGIDFLWEASKTGGERDPEEAWEAVLRSDD